MSTHEDVAEKIRQLEEITGTAGTADRGRMSDDRAAQALVAEATGKTRTVTFGAGESALTVQIPRKWKRFKFLRAISSGDIWRALEAVWPPVKGADNPVLAQLEGLDLEEDEFADAIEQIADALGGTGSGNSEASPS